jgi:catechol 2,3-dioxygenase-like lactoylglutathione lyase family enzyme
MAGRSVDLEGLNSPGVDELRRMAPPAGMPFNLTKLGHVVIKVRDLKRSVAFYTGVLGLRVSDVYPESMMKGGMVFLRCNTDHHCLALIGGLGNETGTRGMHHFAFEVATLGEVLRAREYLRAANVKIDFEGRRRAGCQIAVEFRDPDDHHLEIYCFLDQVGSDGRVRPPEEWREETSLENAIEHPAPGQDTTLYGR